MERRDISLKSGSFDTKKVAGYVPEYLFNQWAKSLPVHFFPNNYQFHQHLHNGLVIHGLEKDRASSLRRMMESMSGGNNHKIAWALVDIDGQRNMEKIFYYARDQAIALRVSFTLDCHHLIPVTARLFTLPYILSLASNPITGPLFTEFRNILPPEVLNGRTPVFLAFFIFVERPGLLFNDEGIPLPRISGGRIEETLREIGLEQYTEEMVKNGYTTFSDIATYYNQEQFARMCMLCEFSQEDAIRFSEMCLTFLQQEAAKIS